MRKCGDCQECCKAPLINDPELQKPAWQKCQHLCSKGCGIYEKRPQTCRKYECAFLSGHIPAKYRPDKLGIIFKLEADGTLYVVEAWPGAKDLGEAKHAVERVCRVMLQSGKAKRLQAAIHP